MNFLAHVQVAMAVADDELVALGAILPDVESLLGTVLPGARDDDAIAHGIAVHRLTDAAFHADARFTTGSIALTRALQARGVPRGASRGIGHAGWELLLDGVVADDDAVTVRFAAAGRHLARLATGAGAERLARFASWQEAAPIWLGYADPVEVAARLHRQLQARPRLSFPAEQLDVVAEELALAVDGIRANGPDLVRDTSSAVLAALA